MLSRVSLALLVTSALALPQPKESNDLETRDVGGIKGAFFKENDGLGAAIQTVPVFMFGPSKDKDLCIPQDARNKARNGPNPGTDPNNDKCRQPTPSKDPITKSDSFPVYFSTVWCEAKKEWRINYSVYYSHDVGHRHDWESVTITFHEHEAGSNVFYRDYVMLSQHKDKKEKAYKDVQSVNMVPGDMDVRPINGRNKLHPKIYVGGFHHGNYFESSNEANKLFSLVDEKFEERGDNYWYMPRENDIVKSSALEAYKGKYDGTSDPAKLRDEICGFKPS